MAVGVHDSTVFRFYQPVLTQSFAACHFALILPGSNFLVCCHDYCRWHWTEKPGEVCGCMFLRLKEGTAGWDLLLLKEQNRFRLWHLQKYISVDHTTKPKVAAVWLVGCFLTTLICYPIRKRAARYPWSHNCYTLSMEGYRDWSSHWWAQFYGISFLERSGLCR